MSCWRDTDRPILFMHTGITLQVGSGPGMLEINEAVGYSPNNPSPHKVLPFSLDIPYSRGEGIRSKRMGEEVMICIVGVHRFSPTNVQLQGHLVDRGGEGMIREYYRITNPALSPDVLFGNYQISGSREGHVTMPKETYEVLVRSLVAFYTKG